MARIRTIKPEFWADEKLGPLDPLTRLVFLGLVGMADDAGRLLDNIKVIDASIFPMTSDTAREALATLSRIGRIRRGRTASGQPVIQITNWNRHQKVDKPNLSAALPELVEDQEDTSIRDDLANDSRMIREPLAPRSTIYDQRSTTNDRRPTTDEDDPRASAPAADQVTDRWLGIRGRVCEALADPMAIDAFDRLALSSRNPEGVVREVAGQLAIPPAIAKGPAQRAVSPEIVGRALMDIANAENPEWHPRRFAAFVATLVAEANSGPPGRSRAKESPGEAVYRLAMGEEAA